MRYKDYYKNSFEPHFLCEWDIILYPYLFGQFIEIPNALFISGTEFSPVVFVFNRENTFKMLPFQLMQHSFHVEDTGSPDYVVLLFFLLPVLLQCL